MSEKKYLVTAGLPYSNGRLHVGHIAGAYLPADTWVRYRKLCGDEVRFICGSDDNGVTALIAAGKEGISVEELTAGYNKRQAADFRGLGVNFDIYGGTHQPEFTSIHEKLSQEFFMSLYEKGYFQKKTTSQLYDEKADQFLPDRYVQGTCYHESSEGEACGYDQAYGDQCESCGNAIDPMKLIDPKSTITGSKPVPRDTTHWYLQLQEFENPLKEWLESKRDESEDSPAWRDMVLNFSLGQINKGLPERAMTRDLDWGVPVPLDDPEAAHKSLYVWFDAPVGYVSFTQALFEKEGRGETYDTWWKNPDCRIVHFVGEDNTIFHALTWPAMLMAEGSFQLPWQVVVNSFLNIKFPGKEEEKISKSRGTAIWIEEFLKSFEPDPLRYYLTINAPENQRTTFDIDDFIQRNNSELLNALGNFINRTMMFAHKYCDGKIPARGELTDADKDQLNELETTQKKVTALLEKFRFKAALEEVMALARTSNGYFGASEPWKKRKDDPAACATVINVCLQTIQAIETLMAPFLPFTAERCAEMLNAPLPLWNEMLNEISAEHELGEARILFQKLDSAEVFENL